MKQSSVVVGVLFLFLFVCFVLLSHHLCRPHRHFFRSACPDISTSTHTQDWSHIAVPPPQAETSDRWSGEDVRPLVRKRRQTVGQEETSDRWSGDVRPLAGCHLKETSRCCRVISVVFSGACSDSTRKEHHLLCPLLRTVLAKSLCQT